MHTCMQTLIFLAYASFWFISLYQLTWGLLLDKKSFSFWWFCTASEHVSCLFWQSPVTSPVADNTVNGISVTMFGMSNRRVKQLSENLSHHASISPAQRPSGALARREREMLVLQWAHFNSLFHKAAQKNWKSIRESSAVGVTTSVSNFNNSSNEETQKALE